MAAPIQFNRKKFNEVFDDHIIAVRNMAEVLEAIGDPRDICVIQIMKAIEHHLKGLFEAVDSGKKMLWHEFLFFPELFRGFPNVHPFMSANVVGAHRPCSERTRARPSPTTGRPSRSTAS
ncbi:MAG: hypothetical protein ACWGSD_09685, partial [Thermodesulfobacteriota bacterium]